MHTQEELKSFQPRHKFFIGIDSDGCVFDTMEIKQKECFIPNIVKYFDLQPVSKYVREVGEFINLYSKFRGTNRYPALLKTFEMLAQRPEVRKRGVHMPDTSSLAQWIAEETKLGLPALKAKVSASGDPFLQKVHDWSAAVDAAVSDMVRGIGPFSGVREFLAFAHDKADMIVVSQTPFSALEREWNEHGIESYMHALAGQELGTKAEHIEMTAKGKYPAGNILLIGDALGDFQAARKAGISFYPILPGHEDESWDRLLKEGILKFFAGEYAGEYDARLCAEFDAALPSTPPWEVR